MTATLSEPQRNVLRDPVAVRELARWVLATKNNAVVARIRSMARVRRNTTPTDQDIQHMVDHLCGGSVSEADLVYLIEAHTQSQ